MGLDPFGALRRLSGVAGGVLALGWDPLTRMATIRSGSRRARRFGHFGTGSVICFPTAALFGEEWIHFGSESVLGPYSTLSAGVGPGHVPDHDPAVRIGDRCVIGKGSAIVAHRSVEIGDDVWTGHHVFVTDANHGYEDVTLPPGVQFAAPDPVRIASRAWLGHGTIVLPGATIGEHAVIGAGAVVAGDIPPFSVSVGNPARVVRRYVPGVGWRPADELPIAIPSD